MWIFDLWHLDLVENKIPVHHILSPEWWQNFTWNSITLLRNIFFSKHQNKVILAIGIMISRTWVVLKTSVASMTSTDTITSLASMTSTASLASKNQKLLALYLLGDFPAIRNLSSLSSSKYWAWFYGFLAIFLLETVEAMDVTFNQITWS